MLATDAGLGCLDILNLINFTPPPSLSLGVGSIETEILSQRASCLSPQHQLATKSKLALLFECDLFFETPSAIWVFAELQLTLGG